MKPTMAPGASRPGISSIYSVFIISPSADFARFFKKLAGEWARELADHEVKSINGPSE
jgi:hypothetical protein